MYVIWRVINVCRYTGFTVKVCYFTYKSTYKKVNIKNVSKLYKGVQCGKHFGIPNVHSYFVHLKYGFKCSLMMTPSSRNMSL